MKIAELLPLNPIALKTAKTPYSFGHSECNRVKVYPLTSSMFEFGFGTNGKFIIFRCPNT